MSTVSHLCVKSLIDNRFKKTEEALALKVLLSSPMSEASQSSVTCIKGSWNKKLEVQLQYSFAVEKKLLTRWKSIKVAQGKKGGQCRRRSRGRMCKELPLSRQEEGHILSKKET